MIEKSKILGVKEIANKYELSSEILITDSGMVLYRVKTLKGFGDVKKGDLGGYIESEKNLSHEGNCWIYNDAWVCDIANVHGNARVYDGANIYDGASVCNNARVYENANVSGESWIYKNACIYGDANVCDDWIGKNDIACK